MNYNDYRTHLLTCEYLGKEPTGKYKMIHDYLTELWEGTEIVVDSLHNRVILQKGGVWFMNLDHKNGNLWCQHERVWTFFLKDMGMKVIDTQDFIKSAVEEHLKCVAGTPCSGWPCRWGWVEEHLKCVAGTPRRGW